MLRVSGRERVLGWWDRIGISEPAVAVLNPNLATPTIRYDLLRATLGLCLGLLVAARPIRAWTFYIPAALGVRYFAWLLERWERAAFGRPLLPRVSVQGRLLRA